MTTRTNKRSVITDAADNDQQPNRPADGTTTASEDSSQQAAKAAGKPRHRLSRFLIPATVVLAIVLLLTGGTVGYLYAASPLSVREPLIEHYHFRMQVLVNGQAVNFADDKFQAGYSKDNCNAKLTASPIHFHDRMDQFVHIHWEGITGGQVLKMYGWNFIGGTRGSLGYRFDEAPKLKQVPIHSNSLPVIPSDANFYVYTRDGNSYKEKSFADFTGQDLEQFFGTTSNFPAHKLNMEKRKTSLLEQLQTALIPKAHAHNGADDGDGSHDEAELKRINNLIGDVVIFTQKDKPTDQQIKDRFSKLVPLGDSTCGG